MIKFGVILVGDNRLLNEAISSILKNDGLAVAHTISTCAELIPLLATIDEQPALILWDSPTILEQDVARWAEISRKFSKIGIVVLTEEIDVASANLALAAGVRAVLPKSISARVLSLSLQVIALSENLITVDASLAGGWHTPPSSHQPIETIKRSSRLSPREYEILQRLGAGSSNKTIAHELGVAESTVKVHLKALMRKLDVSNRTQAAMWFQNYQTPDSLN